MTFFVDANVIIYSAVQSPYRNNSERVLDAIARGAADGRTSPAVLEEVWFIELSGRAGDLTGLAERAYTIFTPLLTIGDDAFRFALETQVPHLGPNDRVHVGTCLSHGIDVVLSADNGFDGVLGVRRVDPLDDRAVRELLVDSELR